MKFSKTGANLLIRVPSVEKSKILLKESGILKFSIFSWFSNSPSLVSFSVTFLPNSVSKASCEPKALIIEVVLTIE